MNEKPGLEPGFFLLDELLAARMSKAISGVRVVPDVAALIRATR